MLQKWSISNQKFLDVQCQSDKKEQHKEDSKGCAILVKRGHIGFLDRFGLGYRLRDSIRLDGLTVTPTGMPFLQIYRVCTYVDEDAVVQIDAVTLEAGGELEMVTLRRTAHRGAGRQEHPQNCNAQ